MKQNTGIMTRVTIGSTVYECDGYVKKDILETVCSHRTIMTLDWTNNLSSTSVLSEANFIVDKDDNELEVEVIDIDPNLKRTFTSQAKVAEEIEKFMKEVK